MSSPYYYTVKAGDSLWRISKRFGVPMATIVEANNITDPSLIHPGQELLIPGVRSSVPTPVSPAYVEVVSDADDTEEAWTRGGRAIRFVIMHDPVAGSVAGLLSYLRKNDRQVSYNEVIVPGSPPKVHRLSDEGEWVGHAGFGTATDRATGITYAGRDLNVVSWGVCLYKTASDSGPFPADMRRAAVALVAKRVSAWRIPVENVLAHREVDPHRRSDPRGLDMFTFRADVRAAVTGG